ncbi:hypothetical protein [Leadbetterella sp. DM7]|uniref:hypothetical protein n=1 Tax=Leadbetterella sp. DM7 TaxID=3235085 RepID=UPI00349EDCD0
MNYSYMAFGLPVLSDLELVALMPVTHWDETLRPVRVHVGEVPGELENPPLEVKPFTVFNEREFLYSVPEVGRYYVRDGETVIIQPVSRDWNTVLLFFYSNAMAAVLFQRDIIPFHVSGVFIEPGRVLLFAAPSRTGKSTTAVMLEQKGYPVFTDDTAVLTLENGKCYACASYPMMRLWESTIEQQTVWNEQEKRRLRSDIELNKYGFHFHNRFTVERVEVAGVVFLEEQGTEVVIDRIRPTLFMQLFGNNIYRPQWLLGMKKQVLQFKTLSGIVNTLPAWKASRPKGVATFRPFADAIESGIITGMLHSEFSGNAYE